MSPLKQNTFPAKRNRHKSLRFFTWSIFQFWHTLLYVGNPLYSKAQFQYSTVEINDISMACPSVCVYLIWYIFTCLWKDLICFFVKWIQNNIRMLSAKSYSTYIKPQRNIWIYQLKFQHYKFREAQILWKFSSVFITWMKIMISSVRKVGMLYACTHACIHSFGGKGRCNTRHDP